MIQLVVAVVKPFRVADVLAGLRDAGIVGCTVNEVRGFGRQGGHSETYRGTEYVIELVPKVQLEILVPDERVDAVLAVVMREAFTGKIGDGKCWVQPVDSVARIRTGESGGEAL